MRRATIVILSLVLLAAPAAVAACGGDVTASGGATGDEAAESTDDLKNVVDRAVETGNLETLTTALTEAGLVETLKGAGPFTVFAPTDEAFDALPDGALDELLADPQGELTKVLTYHVVPGEIMSAELTDGMTVETLQGAELTVSVDDDGNVKIDDAVLVTGDVFAENGVIHVIDAVLLPPEKK